MNLFYIKRPVAVCMLTLGLVVFGFLALNRLPQELLPNIGQPTLTVEIELPGSAPREVERLLAEDSEKALGVLNGLREMESFALPGKLILNLRFVWGHDLDQATQEIRESLERIRLPRDAEKPRILRLDPTLEPVMRLGFTSEIHNSAALRSMIDLQIRPILETLPGVATTMIKGGDQEEIRVEFKPGTLESFGLRLDDVAAVLTRSNGTIPGGKLGLGDREVFVRIDSQLTSMAELGKLVLKESEGRTIRMQDVATIQRIQQERSTITRQNLKDSIFLDVYRESSANMVKVADLVRSTTEKSLPRLKFMSGSSVSILSDSSEYIKGSIANMKEAALVGALLSVLILYFFLGEAVPAFLISMTIPIAVPITFFLMKQKGLTINFMSLGGLTLGIGMLVDNSIVVLENISRYRKQGLSALNAATRGTREMVLPVLASTLTSVAVFLPIAFLEDMAGRLFSDLSWTVVFSLGASLLVAIGVLPTLYLATDTLTEKSKSLLKKPAPMGFAWRWVETGNRINEIRKISTRALWQRLPLWAWNSFWLIPAFVLEIIKNLLSLILLISLRLAFFLQKPMLYLGLPVQYLTRKFGNLVHKLQQDTYPVILNRGLKKPGTWLIGFTGIAAFAVWSIQDIDGELIAPLSNERLTLAAELPVGTQIRKVDSTSFAVEQLLGETPGILAQNVIVGMDDAAALTGESAIHKFKISFTVDPEAFSLIQLKKNLAQLSGFSWKVEKPRLGIKAEPLGVILFEKDLQRLYEFGSILQAEVAKGTHLVAAKSTLADPVPEFSFALNKNALLSAGLSPEQVTTSVADYLKGKEATNLQLREKKLPIRLAGKGIDSELDLLNLLVMTPDKKTVPLRSLAKLQESQGSAFIYHHSGQRAARLSFNLQDIDLNKGEAILKNHLQKAATAGLGDFEIVGQSREYQESLQKLISTILLSVFMVYLVMACQFESFGVPLLIMGSIPLAFCGVAIMLELTGRPLSLMVLVGSIVLVGIVVNNAIILVDLFLRFKREGMEVAQAIAEAARQRLRPILMTTLTTILGLIPMGLASGEGSAMARSISYTVISGLGFATLLTLILIPLLLGRFGKRLI